MRSRDRGAPPRPVVRHPDLRASALDPPPTGPTIGHFPLAGLVRQARRTAGLGQRQMARFAKVAPSTVGREARRRRSQWEVRVAKYRGVPPPKEPRVWD
ncbi:hypothetical protein GA0070624_0257 [Micromonospora rhizosphaerae]|uniref:Helix-turn-helix domain-containing protein n=1 Tax=Micromonospora rhizosphaerae TaxID=568872 RepID=A0A1C6R9V5_9ACTN|nr:helix-turn-helix transcriptional regulator [Micromonospora rhizosphaerae]SCL13879.1 hypothetical protein GA0070624_0257 [Micromonospora rhizosphaerae]